MVEHEKGCHLAITRRELMVANASWSGGMASGVGKATPATGSVSR